MFTSSRFLPVIAAVLASWLSAPNAYAAADKDYPDNWSKPGGDAPDKEVPGWLVNLGPTGARAILTETSFIVRYIFKDSPAVGKLNLGDEIVGVFGKPFNPKRTVTARYGYEGPIMELGQAIEKAEGKDGKLILSVTRGTKTEEVTINLEAIGTFSSTFPIKCKKSELLRARALKYFVDHPEADGACNTRSAICLALLVSDDPKHQADAKQRILRWAAERPDDGTWTWPAAYQLITLGEYHLLTKDPSVLPAMKLASAHLEKIQYKLPVAFQERTGPTLVVNGVTFDYDKLKAAIQLYDGGFGHGSPGGYGPMQYTTILAVIGWQLAERSGLTVTPARMTSAFKYIHYGTNASGALAYGSEFTFGGYAIEDPEAFGRSTGGERAVGKSGAALIAHKLAAERADSTEYIDKYKKFYKTAYAGLPNGHADGNLNLFWGFVAAGAMEDDAILRTVMDYFKPWINMSRCFDGSFVAQPNRHSGDDDAYYHSSRYNPTASMALALAMGAPKLMIQGIQVSIPGVNPKTLRGTLAAAYKSIVGKAYGDAVRAVKSAGPEDAATAAAMSEYLDSQARRVLDPLGLLEKSGHWVQLKDRIERERKAYAGIASFDDAVRAWDAVMLGKTGSAILAADKAIVEGHYGRAQAALLPALSSAEDARLGSIAQAVAARIAVAAKETVARWSALETSGEWHTLRKELDTQAERWRGIAAVEEKSKSLDAALKPDTGRALVDAHRLLLDDAFGPALAAVAPALADTAPAGTSSAARALQARVQAAAEKALGTLEAMEKDGRWQSLRDSVAKAKPKMAGFKAFEERNKAWEEGFATTSGRALIASDQQALQGFLGNAWRALDPALSAQDARATVAKKRIEESVKAQLAPLAELETKGDWYKLERGLSALRRKLAGIPAFDEKDAAWQAAFKSDPAKSSIRLGATLQQLREAAARSPSKALIKEVEAFVQQAGDNTFYGREAKGLLETLKR